MAVAAFSQGILHTGESSLRARLLVLVLLAVVPALGLTLYTGAEQRRLAAAQVQKDALRLARIISGDQQRLIEGARQLLRALAQLPEVRGGDPAACSALFAGLLKQYPLYANFGVIKPDGTVFCSGLPLRGPLNLAFRAYFRRAVETRDFTIGEYQIGRITGKASVNFGYPVLDETGRVRAVVFAALDLGWLQQFATNAQLPSGATLTVIDHNGTILVRHPDPEHWVGRSMPEAPVFQAILAHQGEGTVEAVDVDGIPRLYAFTPLGGTPQAGDAYVSIGNAKAIAFAEANRILARNLAGLGLIALLTLVAAWVGGDVLLLRRVNDLLRATERMTAGDLTARTGLPYRQGELSQLARAFDEMAAALEQRAAELQEAEARYRALVEQSLVGVYLVADGQFLYLNQAGATMFGYEPNELIGRLGPLDLVHPEDRPLVAKNIQARLTGEVDAIHHVFRGLRKDGTTIHCEVFGRRILYGGQPAILGTLLDITERTRGEETRHALYRASLQIQEPLGLKERLDRLFQAAQTVLGLDRLNVLLADPARRWLQPIATLGSAEPPAQVRVPIGPEGGGLAKAYLTQQPIVWDGRDSVPEDLRLQPPYDRIAAFRSRSFAILPLVVQGRAIGVLAADQKHSRRPLEPAALELLQLFASQAALAIEHARLYEELRLAAIQLEAKVEDRTRELKEAMHQLEEASRHKSEFLANMSHELRTPLNSVIGFSEILRQQTVGPLTAKQARYVSNIWTSGKHLLQLINDILDLSKVEAGKLVLEPEPLPVATTLEEILVIARGLAHQKAQSIEVEIEPDLPPLQAEPVRFKQICFNLLSNAIKFTPEQGQITLVARRAPDDGDCLEIRVTDTGIGIKAEDLPRLFQEFVQLEAAATKRHKGTGLGLALSKRLVELHGGRIWAESAGEGRGSTFAFVLPFRGPGESPDAPASHAESQ